MKKMHTKNQHLIISCHKRSLGYLFNDLCYNEPKLFGQSDVVLNGKDFFFNLAKHCFR